MLCRYSHKLPFHGIFFFPESMNKKRRQRKVSNPEPVFFSIVKSSVGCDGQTL